MVVEKIRGGGELFRHAWTVTSRFQQFPWKFYFEHSRMFRYFFVTNALVFPLFVYLTRLSFNPANVKQWEEIRAKRRHTFFQLPHD